LKERVSGTVGDSLKVEAIICDHTQSRKAGNHEWA